MANRGATDILACMVTYEPEMPLLKGALSALCAQAEHVVLYDNGSRNAGEIRQLCGEFPAVRLFENRENLGLPVNYNRAAALAREEGIPWLLLMDQDTLIPDGMLDAFRQYTGMENTAVISPVIWDINSEEREEVLRSVPDEPFSYVRKCLSSASLYHVETLLSLGGFDERLFIDWIDLDYSRNVSLRGLKMIRVNSVLVRHRIGDRHVVTAHFLWKKHIVGFHSPFRTYYFYRNALYFFRKYRGCPEDEPGVFLRKRDLCKSLFWLLYEDRPLRKEAAALRGILAGLIMKLP